MKNTTPTIQETQNSLSNTKDLLKRIGTFTQNPKEISVVKARQGNLIKEYDFNKPQHKAVMLNVLAEWTVNVGAPELTDLEKMVISKFVVNEWGNVTFEEMQQAMIWSITGRLSIDATLYGKFSPMYLSKILIAYLNERDEILNTLNIREREKRWKDEWDERHKPLSMEERIEEHKKFLIRHLTDMKNKKVEDSAGSLCWHFLVRCLEVDESQFLGEAQKYAIEKVNFLRLTDKWKNFIIKNLTREQVEEKIISYEKDHMKNFLIWEWLEKVDNLEEFVCKQPKNIIVKH